MMVSVSNDSADDAAVYRKRGTQTTAVTNGTKPLIDNGLQQKMVAVRRKYHIYWRETITRNHLRKIAGASKITL